MTCNEIQEKLTDYIFGELTPAESRAIEEHLALCEGCRTELEQLREAVTAVEETVAQPAAEEDEIERIIRAAEKTPPAKKFWRPGKILPIAATIILGVIAVGVIRLGEEVGVKSGVARQEQREILTEGVPEESPSKTSRQELEKPTVSKPASSLEEKSTRRSSLQQRTSVTRKGYANEKGSPVGGVTGKDNNAVPGAAVEVTPKKKPHRERAYAADEFKNPSALKEKSGVVKNPPAGRSYQTLSTLAPGAESGGQEDNPSIQGSSSAENRYIEDGIDTTDPLLGTSGTDVEFSYVQEVEVKTGDKVADEPSPITGEPVVAPPQAKPAHSSPSNVGGTTPPNGEPYPSMFFKHAGVNPFIVTTEDPLSTFAVDVDTASYALARSYIDRGHLPPPEAVRVEEFVNAFPQGYPPEYHNDWAIHIDGSPSPFGKGYHLIRVGLVARSNDAHERKPLVLTFVIDISGSMSRENRLGLVRRSLSLLVKRLDSEDTLGIAVFGSRGRVYMPSRRLTPENKRRALDAIAALHSGGSTNAEEGLRIGYQMASDAFDPEGVNRVILCSDGVANVGRTGPNAILKEIKRDAERGIFLTTVGFGMGNYNDVLMEKLADSGNGFYRYIDTFREAKHFFLQDLSGMLDTVAKDVKIQVEFNPKTVKRYRLLGFENREIRDKDFRNDAVDAGEVNAGHTVVALYEVKLTGRSNDLGVVRIRYKEPLGSRAREIAGSINRKNLVKRFRNAGTYFQVDALVAQFAEILRGSYWAKGDGGFRKILRASRFLPRGRKLNPQATEFLTLVRSAERLEMIQNEQ